MNKTSIEWARNPDGTQGYTLNSKTGCLNHTPDGLCLGGLFPCYAYRLANGRLKERYLADGIFSTSLSFHDAYPGCTLDPFYPRFWPERLEQPYKVKKPSGIFLDDMSDWMSDYWPKEWTEQEIQMMKDNPHHRIYTLTKQPQNLIKFSPFPPNCYVGVTVTRNTYFNTAVHWLRQIETKCKYISFEPLLERVEIETLNEYILEAGINWLIIGAQTKPYKPPAIEHVKEIVEVADRAGIPIFLKDNLRTLILDSLARHEIDRPHFLSNGGLRQEMPV